MKVSIITVVWNGEKTILDTIKSVANQTYENIEYIVIDGKSTDRTMNILIENKRYIKTLISEEDNGLYDAMNKGIKLATGDVIGILNADDLYINDSVIEEVVNVFNKTRSDSVFADLVYTERSDTNKILRYFNSQNFKPSNFQYGLMPAHPTFFVKKFFYEKLGVYRLDFNNAADYDLLIRFLYVNKLSYSYINYPIVKMRMGGRSTSLRSLWVNNYEILKACKVNKINTNIFKIFVRYFVKLNPLWRIKNDLKKNF